MDDYLMGYTPTEEANRRRISSKLIKGVFGNGYFLDMPEDDIYSKKKDLSFKIMKWGIINDKEIGWVGKDGREISVHAGLADKAAKYSLYYQQFFKEEGEINLLFTQ